jgi:hypothetical protein
MQNLGLLGTGTRLKIIKYGIDIAAGRTEYSETCGPQFAYP